MGITSRAYIFSDNGEIRRVPQRVGDALVFGQDAIPEFAGTKQRVVNVLVENKDQKPVRILDAQGSYWSFDEEGRIDAGLQETMSELMAAFDWFSGPKKRQSKERVVDLVPEIKKRDVRARHRWDPSTDDLDRIAADLWPGINGAAEDVALVKGKKPVRPPLTSQAKSALGEIDSLLSQVDWKIQELSEASLKGLAFEARRTATLDEYPDLWVGLGAACDRMRELRARQRTGKGVWYAIIEGYRWDDASRHSSVLLTIAHERCDDRKHAVVAARRLLKEYADRFQEDVTIEAHVRSELEWKPED